MFAPWVYSIVYYLYTKQRVHAVLILKVSLCFCLFKWELLLWMNYAHVSLARKFPLNSNSRNHLIRNMTFMKIVQFFWYTVLQGTMMQFSHLFDAPLLTPLASILVGNYLFQGRFKSHFCYCLLQNYYTSKKW